MASTLPHLTGGSGQRRGAFDRIVRAWRMDRSQFPVALMVLVLGFLVLYPIGSVVFNSLVPGTAFSGRGWAEWSSAPSYGSAAPPHIST